MVTVIAHTEYRSLEQLAAAVLELLRLHPGVPQPIDHLAGTLGCTVIHIEMAVEHLEGYIPNGVEGPDPYVHMARCSYAAVYIP